MATDAWWALQQEMRVDFLDVVREMLANEPALCNDTDMSRAIRSNVDFLFRILQQDPNGSEVPLCDLQKLHTYRTQMLKLLGALGRAAPVATELPPAAEVEAAGLSAGAETLVEGAAVPLALPRPMRYIGVLKPVQEAGAAAVPVDAVIVPYLLPHGGGGSSTAVVRAAPPSDTMIVPEEGKRKRPQTIKTHYVCTGMDCGWNGVSRTRHLQYRPNCRFVPCPMRYPYGEPVQPLVQAFLARCTEEQRRQGLPPHGERALALAEDMVAAVIPEGVGVGDSFTVLIDRGRRISVTVPEEFQGRPPQPGDVLQVWTCPLHYAPSPHHRCIPLPLRCR